MVRLEWIVVGKWNSSCALNMSLILTDRECRELCSRLRESHEPLPGGQGQDVFRELCLGWQWELGERADEDGNVDRLNIVAICNAFLRDLAILLGK